MNRLSARSLFDATSLIGNRISPLDDANGHSLFTCDTLCEDRGQWVSALPAARAAAEGNDHAALQAAVCLGQCMLLGAPRRGRDAKTLDATVAAAAARRLSCHLPPAATAATKAIPSTSSRFAEMRCDAGLALLRLRIGVWSAFVAIDEAYPHEIASPDSSADGYCDPMDDLLTTIASLDAMLEQSEPALLPALQSAPAKRWIASLTSNSQFSLPWWLEATVPAA